MANISGGGGEANARVGEQTSGGIYNFPVISTDSTGSLPDLTTINFSAPLYPGLQGVAGVWSGGSGGPTSGGGTRGGGGPVLPTRVQRNSAPAPLVLASSNYWTPGSTLSPDVILFSCNK